MAKRLILLERHKTSAWVLAAALAWAPLSAGDAFADTIAVRAGERGDGVRLVFDWPAPVGYRAVVRGDELFVAFERGFDAEVETLPTHLTGWVKKARQLADGQRLVLTLSRQVQLRTFTRGNAVVVDLLPIDAPAPAAEVAASPAPASVAPAPAPAVSPVEVRVGRHIGYSRTVFAFGADVPYSLSPSGDELVVAVDSTRAPSADRLARIALPQVRSVRLEGQGATQKLVFALLPGARPRDFKTADGFGIDFYDPAILPIAKTETPAQQFAKVAPAADKPVPEKPVTKAFADAAPAPKAAPPTKPVEVQPMPVATRVDPEADMLSAPPLAELGTDANVMPFVATPEESVPKVEVAPPASLTEFTVLAAGQPLAVVKRGNVLFIAISGEEPRDLAALLGPELAKSRKAAFIQSSGGRVIRLKLDDAALQPEVSVTREGWKVRLVATPAALALPLGVVRQLNPTVGNRVAIKAENPDKPISFADPLVGDTLTLVPLAGAAVGVMQRYRLPEAEIMPTAQGIAVRGLADGVMIVSSSGGVEITTAAGLSMAEPLSLAAQNRAADAASMSLPPLLDLKAWALSPGESFTEARQRLQTALTIASETDRPLRRLDLARFYFMAGMPSEAAALWRLVTEQAPPLADRPEFPLMQAIGALSVGNVKEAEQALAKVNQPTTDVALWRALIAAQQRDWPEAAAQFQAAGRRIEDYPEPYFSRLATAAIETALRNGQNERAKAMLAALKEKRSSPATDYLSGALAQAINETDDARAHFSVAAETWDQYWRVRAEFALTEADLAEKKTTLAEATERLERLRFAWRGDALEFDVVLRLADLHLEAGKYAEAFEDYASLVRRFPNDARTPGIIEQQKTAYRDLFLGPPSTKVPAFTQLAVWERYEDLRPPAVADQNAIRLALAERVTAIDLVDKATALLTQVLETTQDPIEKAKLGARIAGLHLLDDKYEMALEALDKTMPLQAVPEAGVPAAPPVLLPPEVVNERAYLQARALAGIGKTEDALVLLSGDSSDTAARLRVDITWNAKQWGAAADALGTVIGAPPAEGEKLADDKRPLLVNRAIALALAGDAEGLKALEAQFGPALKATPDEETFVLLTRPENAAGLVDVGTLMKRMNEVDLFERFLDRYKGSANVLPGENKIAAAG